MRFYRRAVKPWRMGGGFSPGSSGGCKWFVGDPLSVSIATVNAINCHFLECRATRVGAWLVLTWDRPGCERLRGP